MNEKLARLKANKKEEPKKVTTLARDMSQSLGKLPPQAIDLEESVLGAVLLERDATMLAVGILRPDDFYTDQHKEIYQAVWDLYHESEPVDMRTVVARLRKNGKIEIVGGAFYIAELTSKVSSASNLEYHARILVEHKIKREMIQIASQIHHNAYEDTTDALELLEQSQQSLDSVGGRYLKGNFQSAAVLSKRAIARYKERKDHKGLSGAATGLALLDRSLGGWQPTDLILIAARPGIGKTGFILSCAANEAVKLQIPIGIFSLEMGEDQLMDRLQAGEAEINTEKIFKNYLDDNDIIRLEYADSKISKAPLYIDDTPAISIYEFRARARRLVHEHGVKVIYVDYIQLMKGEDGTGTRDQEIGSISRGLKRVAKELKIPIIALSQLSRAVETRGGDKRPQLSDLRESGNLEQDADIIIFLYRAEYYKITESEDGSSTANLMEAIIAKHRNGSLGTIPLKFLGKYTKVMDWESYSAETPVSDNGKPMRRLNSGIRDTSEGFRPEEESLPTPQNNSDDMPF